MGKETRQTEEEVGRQHQGMDRPGICQVPEGSGEQGQMEETGCEIKSGAPTTLAVKELMMMMMIGGGIFKTRLVKRNNDTNENLYSALPIPPPTPKKKI